METNNPFLNEWLNSTQELQYSTWLEQLHWVLLAMRRPRQEGTIFTRYKDIGGSLEYPSFAPLRDVIERIYGL